MTDVTLIYKVRDYESTNTQNTEISNEKLYFWKKIVFFRCELQVTQISVATDYVMTRGRTSHFCAGIS